MISSQVTNDTTSAAAALEGRRDDLAVRVCGRLSQSLQGEGDRERRRKLARAALEALLILLPGLTFGQLRERLPFRHLAHLERYLDGLHKAGLPE